MKCKWAGHSLCICLDLRIFRKKGRIIPGMETDAAHEGLCNLE